jgi:CubicO group peptidase (beta-lactamase class C family)
VSGIRYLPPASSFRSQYAYSNVMYVAAGEAVAAVSGRSWGDFPRERIVSPLGTARTTTSTSALADNVAAPHLEVAGVVRPIPLMSFDNVGAAGAVHSSASDMARCVRMLLECGRKGAPAGLEPLKAHFAAYGLGFGLRDHRGRKVASHTGGLPGYVSQVALVPEFVARWRQAFMSDEAPADAYVSFTLKPDASIERVTMAPVSPAIDFSFDFQDLVLAPVPAEVNPAKAP